MKKPVVHFHPPFVSIGTPEWITGFFGFIFPSSKNSIQFLKQGILGQQKKCSFYHIQTSVTTIFRTLSYFAVVESRILNVLEDEESETR